MPRTLDALAEMAVAPGFDCTAPWAAEAGGCDVAVVGGSSLQVGGCVCGGVAVWWCGGVGRARMTLHPAYTAPSCCHRSGSTHVSTHKPQHVDTQCLTCLPPARCRWTSRPSCGCWWLSACRLWWGRRPGSCGTAQVSEGAPGGACAARGADWGREVAGQGGRVRPRGQEVL